jgi:Uncharacterised nucleotidyltransferase
MTAITRRTDASVAHGLELGVDPRAQEIAPSRLSVFPKLSPVMRSVLFLDYAPVKSDDVASRWLDSEIATIGEQRLAALALRLLSENHIRLPEDQMAALRSSHFSRSATTLGVVAGTLPTLRAMSEHGIPFVISKGPGIALAYASLNERPFNDIDILVPKRHFSPTQRLLASHGYSEDARNSTPWGWFDRRCQEAVNLRSPDGGSIDVHHHVPPWLWALDLRPELLVTRSEMRSYGGTTLPLVAPAYNLLITALHVISDHNRPGQTLIGWRDLLALANVADTDTVVLLAKQHRLVGWLRWIIGELPEDVRPMALFDRLGQEPGHLSRRTRLRLLLPPAIGSHHMVGQAFRLPVPNACFYLAGMTLPSRRFLRLHFPGQTFRYVRWWQHSLARLITSEADRSFAASATPGPNSFGAIDLRRQ